MIYLMNLLIKQYLIGLDKAKPLALAAGQEQKDKTTRINLLKDYISAEHQANTEDYQSHNIAADNLRADLALASTNEERAAAQRRYEVTEKD
jgi:acetate kinase